MLDHLSTQRRLLLAVVLSIVFFIIWDILVPKPVHIDANTTQAAAEQTTQNSAPNDDKSGISAQNTQNLQNNDAVIVTSENLVKISGKTYQATIDKLGRISSFTLNEAKFKDENGEQISLVNLKNSPLPLEVRFSNTTINNLAFNTDYSADKSEIDASNAPQKVVLSQNLGDLTLTKEITFHPQGEYDLKVTLNKNEPYFITPGFRPGIVVDGYTIHGSLIRKNDGSLEILEDGDVNGDEIVQNADIVASSDIYYTTLFFNEAKILSVYIQKSPNDDAIAFVRGEQNFSVTGYIGPKDYEILKSINATLTDVVEYGWFTFIAKPMFWLLSWIQQNIVSNWGWAIVVLTLIIRVVLFPLTYKGMVSMNKLKDLAPKMKEIQAKYKGDPQKLNTHLMELYKKHDANPMGGCLPILIQIPIFFAIYRVLLNAIELKGAAWILWIEDLAVMDPYFILPVLMGVTMFLQQKITPTNFTDPMQEKIMKFLPLIFVIFFVTFPAGLTLYWFVNNLCSVGQQIAVNRLFKMQKNQEIAEKK